MLSEAAEESLCISTRAEGTKWVTIIAQGRQWRWTYLPSQWLWSMHVTVCLSLRLCISLSFKILVLCGIFELILCLKPHRYSRMRATDLGCTTAQSQTVNVTQSRDLPLP